MTTDAPEKPHMPEARRFHGLRAPPAPDLRPDSPIPRLARQRILQRCAEAGDRPELLLVGIRTIPAPMLKPTPIRLESRRSWPVVFALAAALLVGVLLGHWVWVDEKIPDTNLTGEPPPIPAPLPLLPHLEETPPLVQEPPDKALPKGAEATPPHRQRKQSAPPVEVEPAVLPVAPPMPVPQPSPEPMVSTPSNQDGVVEAEPQDEPGRVRGGSGPTVDRNLKNIRAWAVHDVPGAVCGEAPEQTPAFVMGDRVFLCVEGLNQNERVNAYLSVLNPRREYVRGSGANVSVGHPPVEVTRRGQKLSILLDMAGEWDVQLEGGDSSPTITSPLIEVSPT